MEELCRVRVFLIIKRLRFSSIQKRGLRVIDVISIALQIGKSDIRFWL